METTDIKREIISFYEKLYSDTVEWRPSCNMNNCPSVTSHYRGTRKITEAYRGEGSLECLQLYATDKTPKPDVYTMVLFNQMMESNKDRCNGNCVEFSLKRCSKISPTTI